MKNVGECPCTHPVVMKAACQHHPPRLLLAEVVVGCGVPANERRPSPCTTPGASSRHERQASLEAAARAASSCSSQPAQGSCGAPFVCLQLSLRMEVLSPSARVATHLYAPMRVDAARAVVVLTLRRFCLALHMKVLSSSVRVAPTLRPHAGWRGEDRVRPVSIPFAPSCSSPTGTTSRKRGCRRSPTS